ncbi:hypothetical protein [Streptomyces sp. NPDC001435]|uniref:hypothetical protein n=1 Tax=Streptomyces sp. NPDC001435 TaxID=3364576 RepID=UPI00367B2AC9
MARRRRPAPPERDDEVPDWLWGFDGRDWGWHSKDPRSASRAGLPIDGHYAAKMRWRDACREWLGERGLVTREHYGNWQEFKRIQREEPHRILRQPDA